MQVVEQIRLKKADAQYVNSSDRATVYARMLLNVILISGVQLVVAV